MITDPYDRRSGRTTRIIDEAIQELFVKGKCVVKDHHYGLDCNSHRKANTFTFRILLRRLELEHGHLDQFKINHGKFEVKLIPTKL